MNTDQRPALSGLLLAAAGAIAFSGKAIIVKLSYLHGVDAVTVIMYRMLFALPLFILMVLLPLSAAVLPVDVLWLGVLNALACTVAPVLMVMMAIERIGAALTAQTGMIGPMSTIALGVWLLDEPLNLWIGVGTLLVVSGVFIVSKYGAK